MVFWFMNQSERAICIGNQLGTIDLWLNKQMQSIFNTRHRIDVANGRVSRTLALNQTPLRSPRHNDIPHQSITFFVLLEANAKINANRSNTNRKQSKQWPSIWNVFRPCAHTAPFVACISMYWLGTTNTHRQLCANSNGHQQQRLSSEPTNPTHVFLQMH